MSDETTNNYNALASGGTIPRANFEGDFAKIICLLQVGDTQDGLCN